MNATTDTNAPARIRRVYSELRETVAEYGIEGERAPDQFSIFRLLQPLIGSQAQEVFCALMLDGKYRVTAYAEITRGTLTASLVHPREVFGPAVRLGAAALIVAHNHPSGDPEPSAEDLNVTKRLSEAGALLGIPLLDHVILGADSCVSLRARGVLT